MNKSNNLDKVIKGGTNDMGLGTKTLAESINVTVNVVPVATEGKPLSVSELNRLRIGNGLGQHPTVTYGVGETKARKTKAKPAKKAKR